MVRCSDHKQGAVDEEQQQVLSHTGLGVCLAQVSTGRQQGV